MIKQKDPGTISLDFLPFFDRVFKCLTSEDKDKLSAVADLFEVDPFLKDFIQLLPEVFRDVFEILRNLVLYKKEGLADLTNITKLVKIILSSQSLVTQLSQQSKQLFGEDLNSPPDDEGDQQKNKRLAPSDNAQLISLVSDWFKLIGLMLNKEKPISGNKRPYLQMQETITATLKSTFKYYESSGKLANSPFANLLENQEHISQVFTGLIWLSKGDIIGCQPLALMLGGFPGEEKNMNKFKDVVELLGNNILGFKFTEDVVESQQRPQKGGDIVSKVQQFGKGMAREMLA